MQTGTVVIYRDIIGLYVGTDGMYTLIQTEDNVVRKVIVNDIDKCVVANPFAIAHLHYTKLVEIARNS